eukprot:16179938-Heterocapsa_arctica.AAC.1
MEVYYPGCNTWQDRALLVWWSGSFRQGLARGARGEDRGQRGSSRQACGSHSGISRACSNACCVDLLGGWT